MRNSEYLNLKEFLMHVEQDICLSLEREKTRFPSSNKLLDKFRKRRSIFEAGNYFKEIFEIVNELCVSRELLSKLGDKCYELDYEPPISNTAKTIDFKVLLDDSTVLYIDVKTIHPDYKDNWCKFKNAVDNGRIPQNVEVILDKKYGGGHIWHAWYNSRERMLKHTISLEEKIALLGSEPSKKFFMLFCSNGSDWRIDASSTTSPNNAGNGFATLRPNLPRPRLSRFLRLPGKNRATKGVGARYDSDPPRRSFGTTG